MKFILGKKIKMTQKFKADGEVVPVTLIKTEDCFVTQLKNDESDNYNAIQVGTSVSKKEISRPQKGHLKDMPNLKTIREFRINGNEILNFKRSDKIDLNIFLPGEKVDVIGISKGAGFAGVVKRHHFHGHPASHGHKDQLRMPGSIGDKRQGPVSKGKRMAGRMGCDRVTVKNLEIIEVDKENNILAVKGAVPGKKDGLLLVKTVR